MTKEDILHKLKHFIRFSAFGKQITKKIYSLNSDQLETVSRGLNRYWSACDRNGISYESESILEILNDGIRGIEIRRMVNDDTHPVPENLRGGSHKKGGVRAKSATTSV